MYLTCTTVFGGIFFLNNIAFKSKLLTLDGRLYIIFLSNK